MGNFPGLNFIGGNCPEGSCPGGECSDTIFHKVFVSFWKILQSF